MSLYWMMRKANSFELSLKQGRGGQGSIANNHTILAIIICRAYNVWVSVEGKDALYNVE